MVALPSKLWTAMHRCLPLPACLPSNILVPYRSEDIKECSLVKTRVRNVTSALPLNTRRPPPSSTFSFGGRMRRMNGRRADDADGRGRGRTQRQICFCAAYLSVEAMTSAFLNIHAARLNRRESPFTHCMMLCPVATPISKLSLKREAVTKQEEGGTFRSQAGSQRRHPRKSRNAIESR